MKLPDKIIKLRKAHGWSQEDLAEKLYVSRQAISRWENGTALPDANNILQLSKLFNVTTDYLLNEEYSNDTDIPFVKEVRGKGLMIGIQLDSSVKPFDVEVECLNQGLCTTVAGSDVVRFLPPLNISYKEIDEGLAIFEYVLEGFCK